MPIGVYERVKKRSWKISDTSKMTGRHPKSEFKKGISPWNKNKELSDEHKEKLSLSHIGKIAWNKGKELIFMQGENNPMWKGDEVSYRSLHKWVERKLGKPTECSICNKTGNGHEIHWANISGEYKREINDWIRLCVRCHKNFDKNKLKTKENHGGQ